MRLKPKTYSDVALVKGVFEHDSVIEQACYNHCRRYFDQKWRGVFFVGNEHKEEIFEEAFIKLWENIQNRKVYVEDNTLRGKKGKEFSGTLTTYFMKIAKLKFMEWLRANKPHENIDDFEQQVRDILYDMEDNTMLDIISDCISHMSSVCSQILTMFYYQEKSLDDIMLEMPDYKSKDALKTNKYKCLQKLKKCATTTYERFRKA